MSTIFDVCPTKSHIPSYREVLERSSEHLNRFLQGIQIRQRVEVTVGLRSNDEDSRVLPIVIDDPCWWPEETYAWFSIKGLPGGTDAYTDVLSLDHPDEVVRDLSEEIVEGCTPKFPEEIARALEVGRYWSFRRSMGQPAIINIGYGLIAASLAELTDGIVVSNDGAWEALPMRPRRFFRRYFRPARTKDAGFRDWAERCIRGLPDELRPLGEPGAQDDATEVE